MAIREVRLNFECLDERKARELNGSIGQPLTWFMNGIMRNRFKMYSGPEVKGINIVNMNLRTSDYENSNQWEILLNTYDINIDLDLRKFKGDRVKRVKSAIKCFCEAARRSSLPQMQLISEHAFVAISEMSVNEAITKSDNYYAYVCEQQEART